MKAMELSMLCDCEIGIVMFGPENSLCHYASSDIGQVFRRFSSACFKGREIHNNDTLGMGYLRGIHETCSQSDEYMDDPDTNGPTASNRSESVSGCSSQHNVDSGEHLSKEVSFYQRTKNPRKAGIEDALNDAQHMLIETNGAHLTRSNAQAGFALPEADEKCYKRIQQRFDSMHDAFFQTKGKFYQQSVEPPTLQHTSLLPVLPPSPDFCDLHAQCRGIPTMTSFQAAHFHPPANTSTATYHREHAKPRPIVTPLQKGAPQVKTPASGLPSPTDYPWLMLPTPRESIISASAMQAIIEEHNRYQNIEGAHCEDGCLSFDRCAAWSSLGVDSPKLDLSEHHGDPSMQIGPSWEHPTQKSPITAG